MVSLIAEFVFEVTTNDGQGDAVCGNHAGTAADSNLIMTNDKNPQIFLFSRCLKKKIILNIFIPHRINSIHVVVLLYFQVSPKLLIMKLLLAHSFI